MMNFAHSQKGASVLSWMTVLALVAFFASAAMKMLPHYMDYMTMEKLITSVETDKAADVRSIGEFYSYVAKGMEVNTIRDLPLKEVLKVELVDNEFRAHLEYEKREPLIQNLDLVARFDKEFRVRMP